MILDTTAVSALFEGDLELEGILGTTSRHHLPVVVIGEYRYGIKRARNRTRLTEQLDRLEEQSEILLIDTATARHYADIRDRLREQGTPIPENDIWIAALASQHHLAIASKDNHYDHVKSIKRQSW